MTYDSYSLCKRINSRRMRELLCDFALIPAPTNDTVAAAEWYAGFLRSCGAAEVQILREQRQTPSVIAGFPGMRRSPILEVHGCIGDGEDVPAEACASVDQISGTGLVGAKAELIAAAEAARVLADFGPLPGGGLLFVVTPRAGRFPDEALSRVTKRGVQGDAVLIVRGENEVVPVVARGSASFQVEFFSLDEDRQHAGDDNYPSRCADTPIDAAQLFIAVLRRRQRALSRYADSLLGPEQVSVLEVRSSRAAGRALPGCTVSGQWQWLPRRGQTEVFVELRDLAQKTAEHHGTGVNVVFEPYGEGFSLDCDEPLVRALQSAYQQVTDRQLPLGAGRGLCRTAMFFMELGIPAVSHGLNVPERRRDREGVSLDELVRLTRTYLHLYVHYLSRGACLERRQAPVPVASGVRVAAP